jgi:hypothetical protein
MKTLKDAGEDILCDLPCSMHALYGTNGGGVLIQVAIVPTYCRALIVIDNKQKNPIETLQVLIGPELN